MTTWQELVDGDRVVGGDLEIREDRYSYRGPIIRIGIHSGRVVIKTAWMARSLATEEKWVKWPATSFSVPCDIAPEMVNEGYAQFRMPYIGEGSITLKGGYQLDPADVEGLEVP